MPLEHSADASPDRRTDRRQLTHLVAGAIIGAALLAFVLQNTDTVTFSWLVFSFSAPLWLILVAVVVLSLALGKAVSALFRRERQRSKADPKALPKR